MVLNRPTASIKNKLLTLELMAAETFDFSSCVINLGWEFFPFFLHMSISQTPHTLTRLFLNSDLYRFILQRTVKLNHSFKISYNETNLITLCDGY